MLDGCTAAFGQQGQIERADIRISRGKGVIDAIIGFDLQSVANRRGIVSKLAHGSGERGDAFRRSPMPAESRRETGGDLASQRRKPCAQFAASRHCGHFLQQKLGKPRILPGKLFSTPECQNIELLRPAARALGCASRDEPVTFQGGEMLAHSISADRKFAANGFHAKAFLVAQEETQQMLLAVTANVGSVCHLAAHPAISLDLIQIHIFVIYITFGIFICTKCFSGGILFLQLQNRRTSMTSLTTRRAVTFTTLAGLAALAVPVAQACDTKHGTAMLTLAAAADLPSPAAVDAALRDLWIGHAFQVRGVAQASVAGNKAAAEAAEAAVVANAKSIAAAIRPFYGADAEDALFKLLAGHYFGIKAYLTAAIAKDKAGEDGAVQTITSNAGEIATFLSGANPNLPKDDVLGLLQAHAGHHIGQIQQFIAKDYVGELQTWSDMTQHMYVIADALANAIAGQFPEKFKA